MVAPDQIMLIFIFALSWLQYKGDYGYKIFWCVGWLTINDKFQESLALARLFLYNGFTGLSSGFRMIFTAYNRGNIPDIDDYRVIKNRIDALSEYDVIIGLVADDRSAYAFERFLNTAMTDKCLIECIKYFDLGYQYVFKTKKACESIKIVNQEIIHGEEYNDVSHCKRIRIGKSQEIVTELEKKYRRDGLFMDELLEKYRGR